MVADGQWYWCLTHHTIEPYEACKAVDRLGPYATRQEAEHALDRVEERNEQWDNDPRWDDDDDGARRTRDDEGPGIFG